MHRSKPPDDDKFCQAYKEQIVESVSYWLSKGETETTAITKIAEQNMVSVQAVTKVLENRSA